MMFDRDYIVSDHLKLPVGGMYDQAFDKVNGRNPVGDVLMILMVLIVERYGITIIGGDPESGNDRPPQISADVVQDDSRGIQIGVP